MKIQKIILAVSILLILAAGVDAKNGSGNGDIRIGYTIISDTGNQSVNQPTFNEYEGLGLSVEKFYYNFNNGMRLNADLKNITLNNRNLLIGFGKPGLFGLNASNNQYRRFYNFNGTSFTRRRQSGGTVWFYPQKYVKVYGGADFVGLHGSITSLFYPDFPGAVSVRDYTQNSYHGGLRFNYQGRMFEAEYRTADYNDKNDPSLNRRRFNIRLDGLFPVPRYEWAVLSGGFRHFENEYRTTKFKISTNTVWGGAQLNLNRNIAVKYQFFFDRSSSDSDIIATDNLSHAIYLTLMQPGKRGVTIGYQNDVNDDISNEIRANSLYASAWCAPSADWEFRGEFGTREEDVKQGSRLFGNEDRTRYKASVKYNKIKIGSLGLKFEGKLRKNDDIGSKVNFNRLGADGTLNFKNWVFLSAGYSFSVGKFENKTQTFEFRDHVLYGNITCHEYRNLTAGFEATYYRSQRDLDIERYNLRFSAGYRFFRSHRLEVDYTVHNFDDYLSLDNYYTANIVEINLIKELSF